ncbi:hypothetical protein CEP52_003641 [Fusarium oligoseptatum]|uniref:Uncharacterized protein n=1 Tax=Fusarium oligoseptatum TaxID=2604345 RepID=A0A428U7G7_9HYPO|nr:hypothetical protein CEP52_003641 [Fusarium oligoseptatum]
MMSLDAPYSIHILSLGEACPPASEPDARGDKAQRRHGAREVRHLRIWGLFRCRASSSPPPSVLFGDFGVCCDLGSCCDFAPSASRRLARRREPLVTCELVEDRRRW